MIDTSIQPTARLDLSRAITLLDPTAERRNRRWGTSPDAETAASEPHSESDWRPSPDQSNRPRGAYARPDNARQETAPARQHNVPSHQDTAHSRQNNASPQQEAAPQAEPASPEIPSGHGALPQASLPRAGENGGAGPSRLGHLSGPESRLPESLDASKRRQSSPRAAPPARGGDSETPRPQPSGPPHSTPKPEAPPEQASLPLPLKLAGFPEACVEQPLTKASLPGRAPEAGFLKAAPGSAASRGLLAARPGAPREDNLPEDSAALPAPVRILFKPRPRYPEEALRSRLQGDVLLDVEFRYSGTVEVLGVRRGLGHGFNESAIEAARKLRFEPARRDGRPVDTQATLRVRFQLLQ